MYRIKFTKANRWISVKEGQSVYDAALEHDIQLPVGCRYGGCITCAAKLLSGKVRQPGATALNRRQSREGFVLLCVAIPLADCTIEEGVEVQDTLFRNPFAPKGSGR